MVQIEQEKSRLILQGLFRKTYSPQTTVTENTNTLNISKKQQGSLILRPIKVTKTNYLVNHQEALTLAVP